MLDIDPPTGACARSFAFGRAGRAPLLALVLLVCWLCGAVRPAAAHAFLGTSDPAANAVLPTAPSEATLTFTEPLEQSYSQAQLFDETGKQVSGATSHFGPDRSTMILSLPSGLKDGAYSILWRSLSAADGHTAQGYFAFTVGTEFDARTIVPPPANPAALGPPEWIKAATRWLALLGLAAVVALWPVWLFVLRPAIAPAWQLGPRLTRWVRGYAVAAFGFAVVGDLVALVVQALGVGAGQGEGFVASLTTTLRQTRYGNFWLVRLGLLLVFAAALLGVAWWRPRRRPVLTAVAVLLAASLPLPFSLMSHAAAQPAGAASAVAMDDVHLIAASVWAGGVAVLLWSLAGVLPQLTPAGRRVVLARALPRFSLLALIAWAAMGLTGLYSAWLQVGNLTALRETEYGQTLILKLVLLTPLFLLGAFNLLIVTRRIEAANTEADASNWSRHFLTAIGAETVLLLVVFGVVGFLIGVPPARDALTQSAGHMTIPLAADGKTGTLSLTPGATGPNHYRLELGGGQDALARAPGVQALVRVALPDQNTGQSEVDLVPAAAGAFEGHGSELSIAGDWTIEVIVRAPGQPEWDATVQQRIGTTPPTVDLPPPPVRFDPAGIAALALLIAGLAGVIVAIRVGRSPVRKEAAGLGMVALAIGALVLVQAQLGPTGSNSSAGIAALAAPDQAAVTRGSALFQANCVVCHGADGKGDGPAAAQMKTKPADLTAVHALAHSDADLAFWITNGIAVGGMPGFGGKLSQSQVQDLIAYLRSIQQAVLEQRNAPGAEGCTVAPRTLAEIRAIAPHPAGTPVFAAGAPTPHASPEAGTPADAATIQGVTATVQQLVACSNAGEILRQLALYSDARIRQAYPNGPTPALEAMAATPIAVSELQRVALLEVRDVRRLADGRVAATVTIDNPAMHYDGLATPGVNPQRQTAQLILSQRDGRWLIDEINQ